MPAPMIDEHFSQQNGKEHIATGFFKKSIELNPGNNYAKEMVEKMAKSH
jgi:hypothetical protein